MWNRSLLKSNAKKALSGKWLMGLAACLIYNIMQSLSIRYNAAVDAAMSSLSFGNFSFSVLTFVLWIVLALLVCPVLAVGMHRYFMENRQGRSPIGTIFSVFRDNFANVALVQFLVALKVTIGYIIIIPGVIWQYRYAMVGYLMAENPSMTCSRAMELSRAMMHGEKWNYFVLQLSFIGWGILCVCTFGIGALFLRPYIEATNAEFYAAMRAKAFSMGVSDENELAGFFTYGE